MSLEFNEDQNLPQKHNRDGKKAGIADKLVSAGIAKDINQANMLLIGLVVVLIIIMFFAISSLNNTSLPIEGIDPISGQPFSS